VAIFGAFGGGNELQSYAAPSARGASIQTPWMHSNVTELHAPMA
jgi:hypothetical protein